MKYVLCVLFLQIFFIDASVGASRDVEKAKQSHSPSSHVAKRAKHILRHKKEPANSLVSLSSRRSGECKRCPIRNTKKQRKSLPNHQIDVRGARKVVVSYYESGRKTANGERFNRNAMTVAHKTLPFNTKLKFVNPRNGKSVILRVNDRGPFKPGREFDLTSGAAEKLELTDRGIAKIWVQEI